MCNRKHIRFNMQSFFKIPIKPYSYFKLFYMIMTHLSPQSILADCWLSVRLFAIRHRVSFQSISPAIQPHTALLCLPRRKDVRRRRCQDDQRTKKIAKHRYSYEITPTAAAAAAAALQTKWRQRRGMRFVRTQANSFLRHPIPTPFSRLQCTGFKRRLIIR